MGIVPPIKTVLGTTGGHAMELKKLLYAVDLEDAPHPAIEHVKMVASLTGASVSIVYVLPSETVYVQFSKS